MCFKRISAILDLGLTKYSFGVSCIVLVSLLCWYFNSSYILEFIIEVPQALAPHDFLFNAIVIIALTFGLVFHTSLEKMGSLYLWAVGSFIGAILILLTPMKDLKLFFYYTMGVLFGLCQLSPFMYFWENSDIEKRGRIGGIITAIALIVFSLATAIGSFGLFNATIVSMTLNLMVLSTKVVLKTRSKSHQKSRGYEHETRTVVAYLIPWIVFSVVNATLARTITFSLMRFFQDSSFVMPLLQASGACLGALSSGIMADLLGRKAAVAFGLTIYGIGLAVSGIVKSSIEASLVFTLNGLSWGIFIVLFLLVIWGDLSSSKNLSRRYYLGLLTYYSSTLAGQLLTSQITQVPLAAASLMSCALVFLSNIPLLLASELLPSGFRRKAGLMLYLSFLRKKTRQTKECT